MNRRPRMAFKETPRDRGDAVLSLQAANLHLCRCVPFIDKNKLGELVKDKVGVGFIAPLFQKFFLGSVPLVRIEPYGSLEFPGQD